MHLKKLYLKNFRTYDEFEVEFDENMSVIIGCNDVGKSTLLDALDIFFNDIMPDISDCNIYTEEKQIEIGVCFKVEDDELVIIDASNPTTLKEEFLLNKDGLLDIRKTFKCSGQSITKSCMKVCINANYPQLFDEPIITYGQTDLKKLLNEYKTELPEYESINKTKKADMRKVLYNHLISNETIFNEIQIEIKNIKDDSIKAWDKLKSNFPLYFLFGADRSNSDGDKEVQDPMKVAVREVLAELEENLNTIEEIVTNKVTEIGEKTIEKLDEFDKDIAKELKTIPDIKGWDTIFKFRLDTDDGIPLNKRGSGVRRLILLSYFRAQAEKLALENGKKEIIYAIEEPETSQHPDFQRMIIQSLLEISEHDKCQVIITTHTPEIAKMVDKEALIFISNDSDNRPILIKDEELKLKCIAQTLGVLPTITSKLVICVEGENDIKFITNLNQNIDEFKGIIDLKEEEISIIPLSGSNLVQWVNKNYLGKSNVTEFHLYDGDREDYKQKIREIESENDSRRFGKVTQRREMENYIPLKLIEEEFSVKLTQIADNRENCDIPKHLVGVTKKEIKCCEEREKVIKAILNGRVSEKITKEMLIEDGSYEEIKSWFEFIKELYEK